MNKTTGIELNVKRNFVVYLHEIVSVEGEKNEVVKSRLLTLQKIFLKFLFDKRASMQDLASKSLSAVYNLGDEETRSILVDSLSSAFTGETEYNASASVKEELEEVKGEELTAEFRDNFNATQKKKI